MRAKMVGDAQKPLPLTTVLFAILAGGCADSNEPSHPAAAVAEASAASAALQARPGRGIDAKFTRLARDIPGFGGMYFDKSGKLNVYVKSQAGAAARGVDMVGRLRAVGDRAVQDRLRRSPNVGIQEAKYDYAELQGWKSRLGKLFSVRGVVFTDIDEGRNRLGVGITSGASQRAVEQALARAGVPREAVIISRISPIKKLKTLQDRFRPVPGGVQLFFPAPSEGPGAAFICTLGFNARIPNRAANFFVTASHCSDIQGGNQHTDYFQPAPPNANRIAEEFRDPQYGNPGGLCDDFPGFRCRLSDALLARYEGAAPQFGKIARTTFGLGRIGSLEIDQQNRRWDIVGEFEFPFLGETAHKVGRSSGWTRGPVIITCAEVGVSGTNIIQICQDIVLAGARPGDSGAPVFERGLDFGGPPGDAFLIGVLWGGGDLGGAPVFIFSAMENIEFELGPLATSANPLVAAAP